MMLTFNDLPDAVMQLTQEVRELKELFKSEQTSTNEVIERPIMMQEASELLGLAVPTIYSKVSRGELPAMRRGNRLYFSPSELIAYLKTGRKKTSEDIFQEVDSFLLTQKK
ncbi:helix-turn-helix domain-containing protein [Chryseobacterium sp. A321]